jgi:hypothetical protein
LPFVASYDAATGKELWRLTAGGDIAGPTPIFAHGLIYVTSAHGGKATRYAIRPEASEDISLLEGQNAEQQLNTFKLELPTIPMYAGVVLVPCFHVGNRIFLSGYDPVGPGGRPAVVKRGKDIDMKGCQDAARPVVARILSCLRNGLGSPNPLVRVVVTLAMVNCTPEVIQTPQVVGGFSDLIFHIFSVHAGKGERGAVGKDPLPGGVPVQVEANLRVK